MSNWFLWNNMFVIKQFRFGFCDIQNNQCQEKCYQPRLIIFRDNCNVTQNKASSSNKILFKSSKQTTFEHLSYWSLEKIMIYMPSDGLHARFQVLPNKNNFNAFLDTRISDWKMSISLKRPIQVDFVLEAVLTTTDATKMHLTDVQDSDLNKNSHGWDISFLPKAVL